MPQETFSALLPFQWKDVQMPLMRLRMSLGHDLVEHKSWGVDGASVEDTGQIPVRFSASIPFLNGIAPAATESWPSGDLYPTHFRRFILAFQEKKVGLLQHPEFGSIACRADKLEVELASDRRGGVIVEASWVETLDDEVQHQVVNGYVNLDAEAVNLDAQKTDLKKLVPGLPDYQTSFEDLARSIQAVGDQTALLTKRAAGQIDRIMYRIDNIQRSVDSAKSALTWPTTQSIEKLRSAGTNLRQRLLQANRDIMLFVVPEQTTVPALLVQLPGATLPDIIKLNPDLMRGPIVQKRATVRYYAPNKAA